MFLLQTFNQTFTYIKLYNHEIVHDKHYTTGYDVVSVYNYISKCQKGPGQFESTFH